ncbi:hypothetical protein LIER_12014 [Lithospermum erythrorhizon]|uniref:Uncharacterized protein n=1 Tax=Lithospermum erythrorhizon TaxID=34254 RepID=A0AAV3PS22_LITER
MTCAMKVSLMFLSLGQRDEQLSSYLELKTAIASIHDQVSPFSCSNGYSLVIKVRLQKVRNEVLVEEAVSISRNDFYRNDNNSNMSVSSDGFGSAKTWCGSSSSTSDSLMLPSASVHLFKSTPVPQSLHESVVAGVQSAAGNGNGHQGRALI